eukprot:CAMPEP_0174373256 /NCGR_PEP_ID=MMETSP0811_2-20130205/106430_1 /TAXON_ID=73025 ORGANISM="Eutreptiella gymnastica-like, Strain CCMP1594" /NCGR_SAMPLE_ID=MMETSP0811_2 /ASSEMBLY_ACC=CAM_ASM_000667 /LENGTH=43 /DNA_ID= /DNA_START= /DNA_END= /DNA_ORIENTATION=
MEMVVEERLQRVAVHRVPSVPVAFCDAWVLAAHGDPQWGGEVH